MHTHTHTYTGVCVGKDRHTDGERRENSTQSALCCEHSLLSEKRTLLLILFWVSIYHIWLTCLTEPIQPWIHLKIQMRSITISRKVVKKIQGLEQASVFPVIPCILSFCALVPLGTSTLTNTCEEQWFQRKKKSLWKPLIRCVNDILGIFFYLNTNI